ncbi:MAG: hypothetical protein ACP5OZ_03715 [Candidatus Woesearchaeota archaeon]
MNKKSDPLWQNAWKNIHSLDDIVTEGEKEIIEELIKGKEDKDICQYLKLAGKYFYYCAKRADWFKNTDSTARKNEGKVNPFSPEYKSYIGVPVLQIFCLCDNYKKCIEYTESKNSE